MKDLVIDDSLRLSWVLDHPNHFEDIYTALFYSDPVNPVSKEQLKAAIDLEISAAYAELRREDEVNSL